MGVQWSRDKTHRQAKKAGYRSRAAYKLIEIDRKFSIIRPDDDIIDLGAAPGSWLQVARERTRGRIIGIDRSAIAPLEGVEMVKGDFTESAMQSRIRDMLPEADVILCDASPHLSGQKAYDHARAIGLAEDALTFCRHSLKPGGHFVVKAFQGDLFPEFLATMKGCFSSVKSHRVRATRRGSSEMYIVGKGFFDECGA
ncbi:MAG: RlmE family RNA methyltransferase [Methanomicrobiales archaeon]